MRRLLPLLALLALTHAALAQAPAPTVAAAPTPPPAQPLLPPVEDAFVKAIDDARQAYANGINDMVRGAARPRRAEALCRAVPRGRIENWEGRMTVLGSSPGGRGVVAIEIAPKVIVATNRTDAADERDKTLVDMRSPLFAYLAALAVGDRVQFSGTLVAAPEDCFKEAGRELRLSMTEPEFVIRLDAIRKLVPAAANAVLSGQAPPMTIAQSSDYVRDAVDVIAGGVACGTEQRRVFATIIKILIKATAGQSNEQRDLLIGLMFTPPSAQSQTKDNCDAKAAAFNRLESDAS